MGCCTGRGGSTPGATRWWTASPAARRSTGSPRASTRRDGPRRGTHRGAGLGGGGGWAGHPRAEQVLPRRLLRPRGRRGLPGRPCRGAAAAGPDPAVDGPGPGGPVRPLRRRVRHSAGDAGLPRGVQGRSRPLRPARRPLLQPGLRGGLRRRRQPRGLGPCLQRGHRGQVGGQAAAHPRRNGQPSPPGPHAAAGQPAHRRRQGLRAAHRAGPAPPSPSTPSCSASCSPERDTTDEEPGKPNPHQRSRPPGCANPSATRSCSTASTCMCQREPSSPSSDPTAPGNHDRERVGHAGPSAWRLVRPVSPQAPGPRRVDVASRLAKPSRSDARKGDPAAAAPQGGTRRAQPGG